MVRLLSGDPALDGALAEEGAALRAAGVAFDFVPGPSTLTAVPAFAGVPVIADGIGRVVALTDSGETPAPDAQATFVFLEGADEAGEIAARLIGAEHDLSTPVAVIRAGSTVEQRTLVSTFEDVGKTAKAARNSPARESSSWVPPWPGATGSTGSRPSRSSAGGCWCRAPRSRPAQCPRDWRPLVPSARRCRPSRWSPATPQQMEKAIQGIVDGTYAWVVFTSANAVRAIRERFAARGLDARDLAGVKLATVGDKTADALRELGVTPDLVPAEEQSSAGLVQAWHRYDAEIDGGNNRVFLPRADIATETLVEGLTELGWAPDDITAYRTVRASPPPAPIREAIKTGGFDAVLFTSSSTVRNLVGIAGKPHTTTVVACIGPATAKTAEEHGLRVDVLASEPKIEVLVDRLAAHGEQLRLAAIEAGETSWKPSRKRAARRRSPSDMTWPIADFPAGRPRRLRRSAAMRAFVRQVSVEPRHLVQPLFYKEGLRDGSVPVSSMPGVFQHDLDGLRAAATAAAEVGVGGDVVWCAGRRDAVGSGRVTPTGRCRWRCARLPARSVTRSW